MLLFLAADWVEACMQKTVHLIFNERNEAEAMLETTKEQAVTF
jgi:hypothetical protein